MQSLALLPPYGKVNASPTLEKLLDHREGHELALERRSLNLRAKSLSRKPTGHRWQPGEEKRGNRGKVSPPFPERDPVISSGHWQSCRPQAEDT